MTNEKEQTFKKEFGILVKRVKLLSKRTLNNNPNHPGHGFDFVAHKLGCYYKSAWVVLKTICKRKKRLIAIQRRTYRKIGEVLIYGIKKVEGQKIPPPIEISRKDRRTKSLIWRDYIVFEVLLQIYLIFEKAVIESVKLSSHSNVTHQRGQYALSEAVSILNPAHYPFSNPQVLESILKSKGKSCIKGLNHLLGDLIKWQGYINFNKSDTSTYTLGENLATTKGHVIFKNELFELLHYPSESKTPLKTPILMVGSWVNKFYILDLRKDHSLVEHLTKKAHPVFMISWVNPDSALSHLRLEDYIVDGVTKAIDEVTTLTKSPIHLTGYCLGGLLSSITLSYLNQIGEGNKITSLTLLSSLLDYEDPGPLNHFMSEGHIAYTKACLDKNPIWHGHKMATAFNLMRPKDYIWPFIINHYYLGKQSVSLPSLHWSLDLTNTPKDMQLFYMQGLYHDNALVNGNITIKGNTISISDISQKIYTLGLQDDDISPWQSVFKSASRFSSEYKFVLADGGHFTGMTNSPKANKMGFYTTDKDILDARSWLSHADFTKGSWWNHWEQWLDGHGKTPTKLFEFNALARAPGQYCTKTC